MTLVFVHSTSLCSKYGTPLCPALPDHLLLQGRVHALNLVANKKTKNCWLGIKLCFPHTHNSLHVIMHCNVNSVQKEKGLCETEVSSFNRRMNCWLPPPPPPPPPPAEPIWYGRMYGVLQYMEQFTTKCRDPNIIKCYKNPLRLHRYNFQMVNAINFLFSTLHTTPFLCSKLLLGVLHMLRARIATSDTPQGMNPS